MKNDTWILIDPAKNTIELKIKNGLDVNLQELVKEYWSTVKKHKNFKELDNTVHKVLKGDSNENN